MPQTHAHAAHCVLVLLVAMGSFLCAATATAELRLPALLGDNAVLQRGMPVPVWGYGSPGAPVTVAIAGQSHSCATGTNGTWRLRLNAMPAGGPYEMVVSSAGEKLMVRNVLVGDVWVASGQSNMVWPLSQSRDGADETKAAEHPAIRLFALPREAAPSPQPDCRGTWAPCSPASAGNFSGVAYFFGRELHRTLNVPIGLIQSDVGGTPAESWTDAAWLKKDDDFKDLLLKVPPGGASARLGQAEYEKTMNDWYIGVMMKDLGNTGFAEGWAGATPPGNWQPMTLPGAWEGNEPRLDIDGSVWYRRTVEIPAAWEGKDLTICLGPIADRDVTYFAGVQVGASGGQYPDASLARTYTVPRTLARAGTAVIAVRVFNMIAAGGFTGQPADMRIFPAGDAAAAIALAGEWRFRVEVSRDSSSVTPMPPPPTDAWTAWSTGGLYNAMVAPLTTHAIKGVIWYQGESNIGRPAEYRKLFPTLIRGWRSAWGQGGFPFLFVQLANFQPRQPQPVESDWAELREAQLSGLALPKTGMAVAIDVGEAADIHPKNKQDVGKRLALKALAVAYGDRRIVHSGPAFAGMSARGSEAIVRFSHAHGGLVAAGGGPLRGFAVAGPDRTFVWAAAEIRGNTVLVSSPKVSQPVAVRYGWADNPDCNLANGAGLPAAPFRTDRWSRNAGKGAVR